MPFSQVVKPGLVSRCFRTPPTPIPTPHPRILKRMWPWAAEELLEASRHPVDCPTVISKGLCPSPASAPALCPSPDPPLSPVPYLTTHCTLLTPASRPRTTFPRRCLFLQAFVPLPGHPLPPPAAAQSDSGPRAGGGTQCSCPYSDGVGGYRCPQRALPAPDFTSTCLFSL